MARGAPATARSSSARLSELPTLPDTHTPRVAPLPSLVLALLQPEGRRRSAPRPQIRAGRLAPHRHPCEQHSPRSLPFEGGRCCEHCAGTRDCAARRMGGSAATGTVAGWLAGAQSAGTGPAGRPTVPRPFVRSPPRAPASTRPVLLLVAPPRVSGVVLVCSGLSRVWGRDGGAGACAVERRLNRQRSPFAPGARRCLRQSNCSKFGIGHGWGSHGAPLQILAGQFCHAQAWLPWHACIRGGRWGQGGAVAQGGRGGRTHSAHRSRAWWLVAQCRKTRMDGAARARPDGCVAWLGQLGLASGVPAPCAVQRCSICATRGLSHPVLT